MKKAVTGIVGVCFIILIIILIQHGVLKREEPQLIYKPGDRINIPGITSNQEYLLSAARADFNNNQKNEYILLTAENNQEPDYHKVKLVVAQNMAGSLHVLDTITVSDYCDLTNNKLELKDYTGDGKPEYVVVLSTKGTLKSSVYVAEKKKLILLKQ